MYLQTLSTSDFETENAEADACHVNRPGLSLFELINPDELSATMVSRVSSDKPGEREERKCTCSGFA